MKHNHPLKEECKHEKLTYCKECDVVECECGREWGKKEIISSPFTPFATITDKTQWYCSNCGRWVPNLPGTHTCLPNSISYYKL